MKTENRCCANCGTPEENYVMTQCPDCGYIGQKVVTLSENFLLEEKDCELIAEALYAFRKENGRLWRKKLIESYENGTDNEPSLRRFRNQYDFSLLSKIKKTSTVREIIFLLLNKKGIL